MTTLSKTSKKLPGLNLFRKVATVDSVIQSLEVVNKLESDLISALEIANKAESSSSNLSDSWIQRASKAKDMLDRAETPEARQAMEVLEAKASRFSEFYHQICLRDQEQRDEIQKSLSKIRLAQKQLTAVEKTQALDVTLRKMAEDANITLDESPSLDHREISRVIHSAQALVELKTGKL